MLGLDRDSVESGAESGSVLVNASDLYEDAGLSAHLTMTDRIRLPGVEWSWHEYIDKTVQNS